MIESQPTAIQAEEQMFNSVDRRRLLITGFGTGSAATTGCWLTSPATSNDSPRQQVKISQIGMGDEHARNAS
jgi:hypothetical protein